MPTKVKAKWTQNWQKKIELRGPIKSLYSMPWSIKNYLHEREQSRREAVRIERARLDIERERLEDDEPRNLVRFVSRPG